MSKPKVDDEEVASIFDSADDVRSKCAACGAELVGTMSELAEHFRSCDGPS